MRIVICFEVSKNMLLKIENIPYKVISTDKMTIEGVGNFIKLNLLNLFNEQKEEKSYPENAQLNKLEPKTKYLEYLYSEINKNEEKYLFLDIEDYTINKIAEKILKKYKPILSSGCLIKGLSVENIIFKVVFPKYVEMVVVNINEEIYKDRKLSYAILETGKNVEIPPFVEKGDTIRIDSDTQEFNQCFL